MATVDGLTGLYNRVFFQNKLLEEYRKAVEGDYELAVVMYDIDHFKKFNDTYGHLFGDVVLNSIASTVKRSLRADDIVARFGGEEFIILMPRTGVKEACEKAKELRKIIAQKTVKDNLVSASVTVSMGVSSYPAFADSEKNLIKLADDALYLAKQSGRNCVKTSEDLIGKVEK